MYERRHYFHSNIEELLQYTFTYILNFSRYMSFKANSQLIY